MIYIAGSNVFGQWFSADRILNRFHSLNTMVNNIKIDYNKLKVLQISWSYNILEVNDKIFISGAWNGKDNQYVEIPSPFECNISNFYVAGNDYFIVLACKDTKELWVLDLNLNNKTKKINFNIEPVNVVKKKRFNDGIKKIAISNDSSLYLSKEGSVYNGILPSFIETEHCIGKVIDIQCGYEHFLLLTDMGRVYSWGNGRRLQLGHGDVSHTDYPMEVEALAGIKITKICAGGWHSLALSEFGDLYAWGWNDTGQLGINNHIKLNKESLESYSIPTLVDIFDDNSLEVNLNIIDIACGSKHSAILLENNSVWTTGYNKYGQLGVSEESYTSRSCFKKAFQVKNSCYLMCGPWTTLIIEK